MLFTVLIAIHVLICIALIIVVLMQSAKGEGLAGAFGGGAITGAVFGGRGAASFLSKATTALAIFFMISCLALSLLSAGRASSEAPTDSAVTRAAQQDLDQQAQEQQAVPPEGQAGEQQGEQPASPEDIFNQQQTPPPPPDEAGGGQ